MRFHQIPEASFWMACLAILVLTGGCRKDPSGQATGTRRPEPEKVVGVQVVEEAVEEGPLARYRNGKIEDKVRQVPEDVAQGVKLNPREMLPSLVRFLVEGVEDEYLRVKLIHDWIADNIAYDAQGYFSPGQRKGTSVTDVLRNGSSVCEGYASVFDRMCQLAGIHSVKVSGYARGVGFNPGDKEDVANTNHAWNAVEVEGVWHLVDTTWDAGGMKGREWGKRYRTDLLFASPEAFIHTHFPTEPGWQLLDPPVTAGQFVKLPYLRGEFFSAGLQLRSTVNAVNQATDRGSVELTVPLSTLLVAHVVSPSGEKVLRTGLVQRRGNAAQVHALFPEPGQWRLNLFARSLGREEPYRLVAAFAFEATAGTDLRFPTTYKVFTELGATVLEPLQGPLALGSSVRFSIRAPGAQSVAVVQAGSSWTHLIRQEDGVFSASVPITSAQPARVFARLTESDKRWQGLLEY